MNQDGVYPSEAEFVDYAFRNVSKDYEIFWTCHAGSTDSSIVGLSQTEMDHQFMSCAIDKAKNQLSMTRVVSLSEELLKSNKLTEDETSKL